MGLGFIGSLFVIAVLLFRVDIFSPNTGIRSAGRLISERLTYVPPKAQPAALFPVHTLLEPFFEDLATQTAMDRRELSLPSSPIAGVSAGEAPSEAAITAALRASDSARLEGVLSAYFGKLLDLSHPSGESTIWLNIIVWRVLRFIQELADEMELTSPQSSSSSSSFSSSSTSSSSVPSVSAATAPATEPQSILLQLLNDQLRQFPRPDFLGPTTVTKFTIGTVAPLLHRVQICSWAKDQPLEVEFDLTYAGDSVFEVNTSLVVNALAVTALATLPVQVALSNVYFSSRVRLSLDLTPADPSIAVCFMQQPDIRFDIASALGHHVQLVNIPHIRSILHKFIHEAIATLFVYPAVQTFPLLPRPLHDLREMILASVGLRAPTTTPSSSSSATSSSSTSTSSSSSSLAGLSLSTSSASTSPRGAEAIGSPVPVSTAPTPIRAPLPKSNLGDAAAAMLSPLPSSSSSSSSASSSSETPTRLPRQRSDDVVHSSTPHLPSLLSSSSSVSPSQPTYAVNSLAASAPASLPSTTSSQLQPPQQQPITQQQYEQLYQQQQQLLNQQQRLFLQQPQPSRLPPSSTSSSTVGEVGATSTPSEGLRQRIMYS